MFLCFYVPSFSLESEERNTNQNKVSPWTLDEWTFSLVTPREVSLGLREQSDDTDGRKSVKQKSGVGVYGIPTEYLVACWHGSKPSLVCRLASRIAGLVYRPVVGLSLENKWFLGKRK